MLAGMMKLNDDFGTLRLTLDLLLSGGANVHEEIR